MDLLTIYNQIAATKTDDIIIRDGLKNAHRNLLTTVIVMTASTKIAIWPWSSRSPLECLEQRTKPRKHASQLDTCMPRSRAVALYRVRSQFDYCRPESKSDGLLPGRSDEICVIISTSHLFQGHANN